MDPTITSRPKHWRAFGRLSLLSLIASAIAGSTGWAVGVQGHDPSIAYRLAALFAAGAMAFALIWATYARMGEGKDRSRSR